MSDQIGGLFLAVLLGGFSLFGQHDCGWIEQPTDQHVCEGGSVNFKWLYDETVDSLKGAAIYKSGLPPIDILSKEEEKNVSVSAAGYSFLPNAGFRISDVSVTQAGDYNVAIVFENSSYNLADEKSLIVYPASDCPMLDAYSNPNVTVDVLDQTPNINTTCDVIAASLPVNIVVTTSVPRGDPAVEASIERGSDQNATCYGTVDKDTSCTKQVSITSYGNHSIEVLLAYIGYEPQKTTIYCNIERHIPLYWIIIIGAVILVALIILIICCIYCCCKKCGKKKNGTADKEKGDSPEGAPMATYPDTGGDTPRKATPGQDKDEPYKCKCSFCPEDANEYCCQEIATFDSLTDEERCITQTPKFRHIVKMEKQRSVSNEERKSDAFRELGKWIWHTEDKYSGYPACFMALTKKEFPM